VADDTQEEGGGALTRGTRRGGGPAGQLQWPLSLCFREGFRSIGMVYTHDNNTCPLKLSFHFLNTHYSTHTLCPPTPRPQTNAHPPGAGAPLPARGPVCSGKTTMTEKLLLYGGAIHEAGEVKARASSRSATSDWMELEKARGISISSTAMTWQYNGERGGGRKPPEGGKLFVCMRVCG